MIGLSTALALALAEKAYPGQRLSAAMTKLFNAAQDLRSLTCGIKARVIYSNQALAARIKAEDRELAIRDDTAETQWEVSH